MKVLIAVPKNYGYLVALAMIAGQSTCDGAKQPESGCACSGKVSKVGESENLGELVALQSQIEQDHARYTKQYSEIARTQPVDFDKYEGTEEEYKEYRAKLDKEVQRQFDTLQLAVPCYLNCDFFIL